jgi:hypothetical protein
VLYLWATFAYLGLCSKGGLSGAHHLARTRKPRYEI